MDPVYAFHYHRLSGEGLRAAALADEIALLTLMLCVTGLIALARMAIAVSEPAGLSGDGVAASGLAADLHWAVRFGAAVSGVVIGAMNFLPSLIAPLEFGGGWRLDSSFVRQAAVHAASAGLACIFTSSRFWRSRVCC